MIILIANLIAICIICLINIKFCISFEVAFLGTLGVVYSSYQVMKKKLEFALQNTQSSLDSKGESSDDANNILDSKVESKEDSTDKIPLKEQFFMGFRLSFTMLRIFSYAFIIIGIIALVNNNIFFIIPFLLGVAYSSVTSVVYIIKKSKN